MTTFTINDRQHNNMYDSGQNDLNDESRARSSLSEAYNFGNKTFNTSTKTVFSHSMDMNRRGSTGDIKNCLSGKDGRSDVNNNNSNMKETTKRKFSCPQIEAIIGQYVNPNDIKSTSVSPHTGTMRRCRSLNELPGSLRVPIIKRGETERMKARLEASRAGTEELKKLREKQEKMMEETINRVNIRKMAAQNNKLRQTRRMSGPVWSPDTGLSKITEDVEQTFSNEVFLDKNLRDRTNFDTSTPRRTQSYREISNIDAGRVPDRSSLSLSNTGMMCESDTKDVEESWTIWTKRAEFSVGLNNEDNLLSPQSVSDSTVNLENIESKLRRASLLCHAAITGVNLVKRGSSVFENMDISSTSPNPLHAVLMQYALSRKSGNIQKIQRKNNSAETKCTNNNSESDSHFIRQSVIKKANSANEVTTVFDVIPKCDKMTKEYDSRLSHSKSISYSTSDVCQNKDAKPEKKNKQYSPNARKQRAKNVDEQAESTTCHRPTLDTSCRADDLFQSYNHQKYELSKKIDKPTSRPNSNHHTSKRQKSHDHSEHTRKSHNSEQSLEYVSKADQSNQLTFECIETISTVISNDNYPKRLLTLTQNNPHNLTKDFVADELPTEEIDVKYSLLNTKPINDTHPENNALSLLDDFTTSHGHGRISPMNSPNISDIEMVSDVFSFSSADLINYSSQSPQQKKFTSIASDEGFVTSTPSLVSTNSIQALSIGNETNAFHSKSLSIASDEGYSASPPPSPKQKRTAHLCSSIISRMETRISERSERKTKTKDKSTHSFKQTAV